MTNDNEDKYSCLEVSVDHKQYINGELVKEENVQSPIYKEYEVSSFKNDPLGIDFLHCGYVEVNKSQDEVYQLSKIIKFLNMYKKEYACKKGIAENDLRFKFINYGKTELVFVLEELNGERVTVLIKQPAVEFGKVKLEALNLKLLKERDDNVVAPIDYYNYGDQELYVTPYINQARCVASEKKWGMYVPEPYYRFERFTKEQESVVNSCMIAKLISLYDFENNKGVASCKLGGGDFMLHKGWENEPLTIENTISSLYLIAAREMIDCSFEEYLDIIRKEFSIKTINKDQSKLLLNHRGRVAINKTDIEKGIKLGMKIKGDFNPKIMKKR